jgi:hypothetical protein
MYNPHGSFLALEDLGYLLMAVSFLFAGLAVARRARFGSAVRWILVISGIVAAALLALGLWYGRQLDDRFEVVAIGIDWAVLIVVGVLPACPQDGYAAGRRARHAPAHPRVLRRAPEVAGRETARRRSPPRQDHTELPDLYSLHAVPASWVLAPNGGSVRGYQRARTSAIAATAAHACGQAVYLCGAAPCANARICRRQGLWARLLWPHPSRPSRFRGNASHPLLVDMPVIVRHQNRGALRLDHRHDQALCRRRVVI